MKILIVGAGPTGLTAALELGRHGFVPEIVDAKEEPSKLSRAVGILPRSIEILDRTNVGQSIIDEGIKANSVNIQRDGKALLKIDFSKIKNLSDRESLISLPQDRTESLMAERLEKMGIGVRYNTKVLGIETDDHSATVVFENGERKTYDWVIGADGVNSTVRQALDIDYKGYELDEDWSISDIEIKSQYDPTEFRVWLIRNDRGGRDALIMVPIADRRVRLVSSTPDSVKAIPIDLDIAETRRSGTFKISVRQADKYVKGRVLLAGDAAHVHSPVGGRGMNLGIEDASALVEAILEGGLEKYESERKSKASSVIRWTEFARKSVVSRNPVVNILIKILAFSMMHSKILQRSFVKRLLTL